jgi:dihydrofolate reductase
VARLEVHALSMSEDGYVAGPTQELENPLGVGGGQLHEWIFATRAGREMIGESGGTEDIENDVVRRGFQGIGATIMGRNMFGPVRGPWADSDWTGWWGESPPFHHDVFVLTHFERAPLALDDTTFHFVTDGIEEAIARAREAAGDRIIRLGGGAETIREFLDARLVDSLYLAVVPVTLGSGARLFDGIGAWPEGYACASVTQGEGVTFYELVRS